MDSESKEDYPDEGFISEVKNEPYDISFDAGCFGVQGDDDGFYFDYWRYDSGYDTDDVYLLEEMYEDSKTKKETVTQPKKTSKRGKRRKRGKRGKRGKSEDTFDNPFDELLGDLTHIGMTGNIFNRYDDVRGVIELCRINSLDMETNNLAGKEWFDLLTAVFEYPATPKELRLFCKVLHDDGGHTLGFKKVGTRHPLEKGTHVEYKPEDAVGEG